MVKEIMGNFEKLGMAVVTLVMTGVCVWVGSTLLAISNDVVGLKMVVSNQTERLGELKDDFRSYRANEIVTGQAINLIEERMRQDDEREERDAETLKDLDHRVSALELQVKNGS